ncbi:MAG: hypothetical protein HS104_22625 [Polyangiaceae bacterium]|nr:hypothetical protein [Polyangiaceae bacterium]MCL4750077.1 hypothetical protein [Myxococcales bacterium]
MSPYRSNAAYIRADSLEQLFAARSNLKSEDGLGLSYRFLPWKRHVFVVGYQPESLPRFLEQIGRLGPVSVDVLRSDEITAGRYIIEGTWIVRHLPTDEGARGEVRGIDQLERAQAAHLRVAGVRFGLGEGQLRFEVSGFELDELAQRFRDTYPWERLGLPPLTGREWLVLDRPG